MSFESSCAIPFMNGLLPEFAAQYALSKWLAIYGTLIIEFVAMLLLFSLRTKYYGMLIGMSFHLIVGISSFGTLAHFSAFAIALHSLFLPPEFGKRVCHDPIIPAFLKKKGFFSKLTIFFVILQIVLGLFLGYTRHVFLTNTLFATSSVAFIFLVFKHGRFGSTDKLYRMSSSFSFVNIIPIWFFLHCWSPYIGLGTGGTLQMFSGLRTEGEISNHYIVQKPLDLFSYQNQIVYIAETIMPVLMPLREQGLGMVLFDFQRYFTTRKNTMQLPMKIRIDGKIYLINNAELLQSFAKEFFSKQTWLENRYLSFRIVDHSFPNRCRH